MDYLLSCPHPRYVSYFRFLQAYANGCHILSLPFVESSAKIEFEHMLRRRFMGVQNVNPASIDQLVLQTAWIPLMPRSFFEPRNSISKLHKKTFANRKAKHLRVNIPPLPKQSSLCIVTTVTTPPSSIEEDLPIHPAPLKIKKQNSNNNSKAIKKVVEPKRSKSIPPISALAAEPNCEKDLFELQFDTQFKLAEDCCFSLAKHDDFIYKPRQVARSSWLTEFPLVPTALKSSIYD